MSPEWETRYFSYNSAWDDGEEMASMRNGSGDDWSVTFTRSGAYLRVFDHESARSPFAFQPPRLVSGLLDGLPDALRAAADEPAFTLDEVPLVTLALWRLAEADRWSWGSGAPEVVDGDDGGSWLLEIVDGRPDTYRAFAREYYERDLPLDPLSQVFAHRPLTEQVVRDINPEVSLTDLAGDLAEIGYPAG